MPVRALTIQQVADELGRSRDWLHANWQRLVAEQKLPRPLLEGGALTWSAAQFYAWQDRHLSKRERVAAAAYRAAFEAASTADTSLIDTSVADARARLTERFVGAAA
ncbi:hypothetical protein JDN40_14455 [Rhodomicrobium vannielii ATCC 17100]|uniref:hypothetical protein n=1 Tax=Rhodomicrobium vannielii TaxID=1069 RepID=UPI00191830F6|nr:hypothetical protein [Rhodomicrobium vannielii]MBJ7535310.1 hypothetical protein [Rhodomicrobium vannielii ATCC 17100]